MADPAIKQFLGSKAVNRNITDAFANSLQLSEIKTKSTSFKHSWNIWSSIESNVEILSGKRIVSDSEAIVFKPVLQMSQFPITLNPDHYANPYSLQNPQGDALAAYRFKTLVDPVPSLNRSYSISGGSTEEIYSNLLDGATYKEDKKFVAKTFASSIRKFNQTYQINLAPVPGRWHLVEAIPIDWYDATQTDRFVDVDLNLLSSENSNGQFTILPCSDKFSWMVNDPVNMKEIVPHSDTQIESLKFKYMIVYLNRPWLSFELFNLNGWFLEGQPSGYYSTGKIDGNNGILPLLPIGFIVGIDFSMDIHLGVSDRDLVEKYMKTSLQLSLGPFQLYPFRSDILSMSQDRKSIHLDTSNLEGAEKRYLNVVGWISKLLPYSPASSS